MQDNSFSYSHCMRPGVNRDSHGLKVAQLAGMPPHAIKVAQHALLSLKDTDRHDSLEREKLRALGMSLIDLVK